MNKLLFVLAAAACACLAGCGEMPAAAEKTPVKQRPAQPQMLPLPVVPADAYPSVAAALAEAEAAAMSGKAEDQPKRVQVERWLGMQGAKIEPELSAVVRDAGAGLESRLTACRVLARMGVAATPTLMMEATSSETKQVRLKAIESLGRIKPPTKEIVEKLLALLDEQDFETRKAALAGLGAIGPPAKAAVPSLVEKLTALLNNLQEDDTIRTAAHAALKKIDPRTKFAG